MSLFECLNIGSLEHEKTYVFMFGTCTRENPSSLSMGVLPNLALGFSPETCAESSENVYILEPRRGLSVISTVKMVQIVIFTPKIANFWRFWLIIAIFRK